MPELAAPPLDLLTSLPAIGLGGWAVVLLGALIVGFAKTALPGAGTLAVGLFALALPAKESTAALLMLLIVGDMTALWLYRREPDVRTLVRLLPSALAGVLIGVWFFAISDGATVRVSIGLILLVLVAVTVWRRQAGSRREAVASAEGKAAVDGRAAADGRDAAEARAAADGRRGADERSDAEGRSSTDARGGTEPARGSRPGALATAQGIGYGLLGGFTTMVANAAGPVMSMYFYAMRMPVLTFLGTSAWYFAIVNVLKLPFSAGLGLITPGILLMDALLVPVVLLGALIGARTARRIPQQVFESLVLVLTVVSALALLVI